MSKIGAHYLSCIDENCEIVYCVDRRCSLADIKQKDERIKELEIALAKAAIRFQAIASCLNDAKCKSCVDHAKAGVEITTNSPDRKL